MSKLSTFVDRHMKPMAGQAMLPASVFISFVQEVEEVLAEMQESSNEETPAGGES